MKKSIIILVLILSLFLITGCNKEKKSNEIVRPHSSDELKKIVSKEKNISIIETDTEDEDVYSAIVQNSDGKNYKFYVFDTTKDAKDFFEYYLKVYQSRKKDGDSENIKENISYELTTSNNYYYIIIDENTMVAVDCKLDDKDSVIKLLKSIKYYE